MTRALSLIAFLCLSLVSAVSHAYDVAVMPVKGVNLEPGRADAVGVLLAQQYSAASGRSVAGPEVARAVLNNSTDYVTAAKALGTAEYIESACIALESKHIVTVERHDQSGRLIYSANMTATTVDDFPEVTQRLARSLVLMLPPEQTRTLDNVTKTEGQAPNQTYSVIPKGIRSSLVLPFAKGMSFEPMASFAFDLRIEKRDFFVNFAGGALIPNDSSRSKQGYGGLFAEFSGNYFLSQSNFAPYVGAGVSPRLQFGGGTSGIGFLPFAQIGAMYPRESKARAFMELRLAQNVLPVGFERDIVSPSGASDSSYSYSENTVTTHKYPTEPSLQFGIVW